jgi:hypothetical protein
MLALADNGLRINSFAREARNRIMLLIACASATASSIRCFV